VDQTSDQIPAAETTNRGRRWAAELTDWTIRWTLFFLICLGLGYAGVERYSPRATPALSDAALYYRLVAGQEVQGRDMRFRILVPYLARPFFHLGKQVFSEEKAVALALLIANAIFCATTACLLVSSAMHLGSGTATALLAAFLYLLNFAVVNLQLAGMIDAGEACFMMALTWSLFFDRWWLLPFLGLFGALAKETFVPLSTAFIAAWWIASRRPAIGRTRKLLFTAAMIMLGVVVLIVPRTGVLTSYAPEGSMGTAGITAVAGGVSCGTLFQTNPGPGYLSRLANTFSSRTLLYVFAWLIPLGIAGIKRLPRPWVVAASVASGLALLLGLYKNIEGNVARPIFDVLGPLLSLSAAIWLSRDYGKNNTLRVE
jgi:hypothetical protein